MTYLFYGGLEGDTRLLHHGLRQLGLLGRGCIEGHSRVDNRTVRLDDLEVFDGTHGPLKLDNSWDVGRVCLLVGCQVRDSLRCLRLGTSGELAESVLRGGEQASNIATGGGGLDGEAHDIVSAGCQVLHRCSLSCGKRAKSL